MRFQEYTANHAFECLNRQENARFLIADEVGLGKTVVAREIIRKFLRERDEFTVVYICNNQLLARKNLSKLNPIVPQDEKWRCDIPPVNRLSLFPLEKYIAKQRSGKHVCHFYALTPGTSLSLSGGCGTVWERRLLYFLAGSPAEKEEIYKLDASEGWKAQTWYYQYHAEKLETMKNDMISSCPALALPIDSRGDIPAKRMLLAKFGASLLKPDLVIFDEFQNYEQLFISENSAAAVPENEEQFCRREIDIINGVFARLSPAPKYLLLSATPFAPLTMNEELSRGEVDLSSCEAFCRLIDWLRCDRQHLFRQKWLDYAQKFKLYCEKLREKCAPDTAPVQNARDEVQNMICQVMSRTERPSAGIQRLVNPIDLKNSVLSGTGEKFENLFGDEPGLFEYEKYSFRPLAAMGRSYTTFNKAVAGADHAKYFLPDIREAMRSPYMQKLNEVLCGKNKKLRPLFWMPPTVPTLDLQSSFAEAAKDGYSKVLIFSQYRFIPRMISAGMSAKFENDWNMPQGKSEAYRFFEDGILKESCRELLLPDLENRNTEEIFHSPAKSVLRAFKQLGVPEELSGKCRLWSVVIAVASLRYMLNSNNITYVNAVVGGHGRKAERAARYYRAGCFADMAYEYMYLLASEIPGTWTAEKVDHIGKQFFRVLRLHTNNLKLYFKAHVAPDEVDDIEKHAQRYSTHFADCFSEKEKTDAVEIDKTENPAQTKRNGSIADIVQSILGEEFDESILPQESPDRNKELQSAFNSPFKPFVLSTTSIGQEGLDFHWYCRKIMHWNLPSNPVDFDQREGRINRYGSFALRQTIAGQLPAVENFSWEKDFWGRLPEEENGMVPHWLPPAECTGERKIERIVPFYPLSREHLFINDLLKMQALYRMVIGQPHQDELLSLLRELSAEDREKITACSISLLPPQKVQQE